MSGDSSEAPAGNLPQRLCLRRRKLANSFPHNRFVFSTASEISCTWSFFNLHYDDLDTPSCISLGGGTQEKARGFKQITQHPRRGHDTCVSLDHSTLRPAGRKDTVRQVKHFQKLKQPYQRTSDEVVSGNKQPSTATACISRAGATAVTGCRDGVTRLLDVTPPLAEEQQHGFCSPTPLLRLTLLPGQTVPAPGRCVTSTA